MTEPCRVVVEPAALGAALDGVAPGLVPTMGALHEGHAALIRRAAAENARTVVSIFVNPTQFGDARDLAAYPRDIERDRAFAAEAGADLIFAPAVETVYPPGFATTVTVSGLTGLWEGEHRPGHFAGVATVVAILLNLVRPARAYFGEKDYQQLLIVRRLHRDLALAGEIVGCPTVRDSDGLALSSRNAGLAPAERERAAAIPRALFRMADQVGDGERSAERLIEDGRSILAASDLAVDYLAVVDGASLEPVSIVGPGAQVIVAARVGNVRLIDNMALPDPNRGRAL